MKRNHKMKEQKKVPDLSEIFIRTSGLIRERA